jgi:hypothetical protein
MLAQPRFRITEEVVVCGHGSLEPSGPDPVSELSVSAKFFDNSAGAVSGDKASIVQVFLYVMEHAPKTHASNVTEIIPMTPLRDTDLSKVFFALKVCFDCFTLSGIRTLLFEFIERKTYLSHGINSLY